MLARRRIVPAAAASLIAIVLGGVVWSVHVNHELSRPPPTGPDGLPLIMVFNNSVYDHPREVTKLPRGVSSVGTAAGPLTEYAPNAADPKEIWVTKDGRVWSYSYLRALDGS
ncbi:MAG: hypothetical protein JWQ32_1456 [Marmoricola sp.]|nr:hypothetical protein [Marmoricola sp.]